jgi:hypothetical protein
VASLRASAREQRDRSSRVRSYALSPAAALAILITAARVRGTMVGARHVPPSVTRTLLDSYGSLTAARIAAGLRPPPRQSRAARWLPDDVVAELRALREAGVRITAPGLRAADGRVLTAAIARFGSFDRARRAAGLRRLRREKTGPAPHRWNRRAVIAAIRREHAAGRPLSIAKASPALTRAARKYVGTWRKAVELAGIDYDQVRERVPRYTDDELLGRLREVAREQPELTAKALHRTQALLVAAARRRFGAIEAALQRAGLVGWPRRQAQKPLGPEALRRALEARVAAGESIVPAHLMDQAFPLFHSLCRIGPTPTQALARVGVIDLDRGRRVWTRAAVVTSIQARLRAGLEPGANLYVLEGAIACYGTYANACLAALRTTAGRRRPRPRT